MRPSLRPPRRAASGRTLPPFFLLVLLAAAGIAASPPAASGQGSHLQGGGDSGGVGSVQLLIVGSYHFANPGLDVVQTEVADVLEPARQAEILAVVEALTRFRPTHVAVEAPLEAAPVLDSLYRAYRAGEHRLGRSEREQLGFRIAERMGHEGVHPVDHPGSFPFDALMAWASEHDPAFVASMLETIEAVTREENRRQRELSVGENLRVRNDPGDLAEAHALYLAMARVGSGESYVGADLLSRWYERNIRIHAHLQRLASPGDRILLVIGSGHVPILRELAAADRRMVPVDPALYLPR